MYCNSNGAETAGVVEILAAGAFHAQESNAGTTQPTCGELLHNRAPKRRTVLCNSSYVLCLTNVLPREGGAHKSTLTRGTSTVHIDLHTDHCCRVPCKRIDEDPIDHRQAAVGNFDGSRRFLCVLIHKVHVDALPVTDRYRDTCKWGGVLWHHQVSEGE